MFPHACIGDFKDAGPADHGALFDFGFGKLAPHATVTFNIYYGAAGSETDAGRFVNLICSLAWDVLSDDSAIECLKNLQGHLRD